MLASSEGHVVSLSPQTGEVLEDIKIGEDIFIEPIVAGERVILLSEDAKLIAIR